MERPGTWGAAVHTTRESCSQRGGGAAAHPLRGLLRAARARPSASKYRGRWLGTVYLRFLLFLWRFLCTWGVIRVTPSVTTTTRMTKWARRHSGARGRQSANPGRPRQHRRRLQLRWRPQRRPQSRRTAGGPARRGVASHRAEQTGCTVAKVASAAAARDGATGDDEGGAKGGSAGGRDGGSEDRDAGGIWVGHSDRGEGGREVGGCRGSWSNSHNASQCRSH
jgi:hypothetical protein